MQKIEILGEELWEVNSAEAKKLWRSHPDDRWRIWHQDEVAAFYLAAPEEWAAAIAAKKAEPGKLPNIPTAKLDVDHTQSAAWCSREKALCSEIAVCKEGICVFG